MSKAIIQFAREADIDFIYHGIKQATIESEIGDRFSQTKETLLQALFSDDKIAEALIAFDKEIQTGICLFSETHRHFTVFNKSKGLFIHDIWVDPNYRKKGVATALIEEIMQLAKARDCNRVDAIVLKNNDQGNRFWESLNQFNEVNYITTLRANIE